MRRATSSCGEQIRNLLTCVTDGKPFVIRPDEGRTDGIEATRIIRMIVRGRHVSPLENGELVIDSSYEEVVQAVVRFAKRINARKPSMICVDDNGDNTTYVYENAQRALGQTAATA